MVIYHKNLMTVIFTDDWSEQQALQTIFKSLQSLQNYSPLRQSIGQFPLELSLAALGIPEGLLAPDMRRVMTAAKRSRSSAQNDSVRKICNAENRKSARRKSAPSGARPPSVGSGRRKKTRNRSSYKHGGINPPNESSSPTAGGGGGGAERKH